MKTAVLGCGAIGGLFLGYLQEKQSSILGVARDGQVNSLSIEGLKIEGVRGNKTIKNLQIGSRLAESVELAVFAVKTQNLEEIIVKNREYLKNAYIVSTQNGLAADYILDKYFDREKIVSGIVMFGATFFSPNRVVHNFEGSLILGSFFGADLEGIKPVSRLLSSVFDVSVVSNIKRKKYLKLFLNINNCIPACLGVSMQEAYRDLEVCRAAVKIISEAYKVAADSGVVLEDLPAYPAQRVQTLTGMPQANAAELFSKVMAALSKEPLYGSILQSITRGRPSEIDYINGEIIRLAKENNMKAPVNEKIVELVHRVETCGKFFSKKDFLKEINIIA